MELVKKLMKEADPEEVEKQVNNLLINMTLQNNQSMSPDAIANRTLNLLGDSLEVDAYHGGHENHPMLLDENDSVFLTQTHHTKGLN
jgi:hypothetical protein